MDAPERPAQAPPTKNECMAQAARLLHTAEMHSDRELMDRYTSLAQTWINLSSLHDE